MLKVTDFKVAAWDWWQYSEKVQRKYDLDESAIKPYLSLDNALKGVFNTTQKLCNNIHRNF